MGARAKLIGAGTVAALAFYGFTTLTTPGTGFKPPGNSIRPKLLIFTVSYAPATDKAGPPGIAASWTVGAIPGSATITTTPWNHPVAAEPLQLVVFAATPAQSHDGHDVTSMLECWAHYRGREIAHDKPKHPAKGCTLLAHTPAA
jgi:hypothetical protein